MGQVLCHGEPHSWVELWEGYACDCPGDVGAGCPLIAHCMLRGRLPAAQIHMLTHQSVGAVKQIAGQPRKSLRGLIRQDKAHLPGQTSRPAPLANSSVMVSKLQCDPACNIQTQSE